MHAVLMTEEEKSRFREKVAREQRKTSSNEALGVIRAWTALEVLTPHDYKPSDKKLIASLAGPKLPWEGRGEKSSPKYRLYYEIVLGTIDLEKSVAALFDIYLDKRIDRLSTKGEALLASIIVDHEGKFVNKVAIGISSFAWGLPKALQEDLSLLSEWTSAEQALVNGLAGIVHRTDGDNKLPVDRPSLKDAYAYIVAALDVPRDWIKKTPFAIRRYQPDENPDPPRPCLLNSFFLKDLAVVEEMLEEGKTTLNVRAYLGLDRPRNRLNLLNNSEALEAALAPDVIPPARWPGPGRHSLVVLQQAAVNLAMSALRETGMLAVNGPPGTGKTTLLRDIIASIVTQRAEAMCAFDNPSDAFELTEQELPAGTAWLHFYRLSEKLKGHEVVIASSNNKAVENVSAELPGLHAIADDAPDLRYFAPLATGLLKKESWGLIAAVLGNAKNMKAFYKAFWWDKDIGLSTYLAEALDTTEYDAPSSEAQALKCWESARRDFQNALEESKKSLAQLAQVKKAIDELASLAQRKKSALSDLQKAKTHQASTQELFDEAQKAHAVAKEALKTAQDAHKRHHTLKLGFFARFQQRSVHRSWKTERNRLSRVVRPLNKERKQCLAALSSARAALKRASSELSEKKTHCTSATDAYASAYDCMSKMKSASSFDWIDEEFFAQNHAEKHTSTPWCDQVTQRLRDNVFIAAMKLHKAFIDASAKELQHNLDLLMQVFSGEVFLDARKQASIGDLWSSLFLVVPSISTTFASVERMFRHLPPDSLGWLLIDEAGQALPQAAMGAIMRTKRAVVVGDPLQIEPVVSLPKELTQNICSHFGVDFKKYNAPEASVQTMADAATPYRAVFKRKGGSRSVGIPLLVHRRCADPMFSISNAIAYERLMVQAKQPGLSKIRDCLGDSCWIDVQGESQEKWCPQEGAVVLELLTQLKQENIFPDLYIVTPFVVVQNTMRRILGESGIMNAWVDNPDQWTSERVGTVHTAQGREAEGVILVLGAPDSAQAGARRWAGGSPNLLNVAVTRAKEVIYVVGNRNLWKSEGVFSELADRLP